MTEASYQEGRKIMQQANHLRGMIAMRKGEVAKWTKIEDYYRRELKQGQADGALKKLNTALLRLKEARDKFKTLSFPNNNLSLQGSPMIQCDGCGIQMKANESSFCDACINGK